MDEVAALKAPQIIGWREWLALPDLDIRYLKCKIDTGARTSALHAYFVEPESALNLVMFGIHPIKKREDVSIICTTEFLETRMVTDSGGHQERRYVIVTHVVLGGRKWPIEITLTNRDSMRFRMLLGRTGIPFGTLVDPTVSYLTGKPDLSDFINGLAKD